LFCHPIAHFTANAMRTLPSRPESSAYIPLSACFPQAAQLFAGLLFAACALAACTEKEPLGFSGSGKRPVYLPEAQLSDIRNLPPQPVEQSGSIFLLDTLFFMVEFKKGIHVYRIGDSADVRELTFFNIPAVTEFSISGDRLYADSWRDLVTIDISNLYQIRLLNRQVRVIEPLLFPPQYDGFFECVEEAKGAVIGWEDAQLDNALCRTF
jgi:hypothetical protein